MTDLYPIRPTPTNTPAQAPQTPTRKNPNPPWTDELWAEAQRLRAKNLSYGQIAIKLKFPDRNAIISKFHREAAKADAAKAGLEPQTPKVPRPPKLPRSEAISKGLKESALTKKINAGAKKKRERVKLLEDLPAVEAPPAAPMSTSNDRDHQIPPEQRVTLMGLTKQTCRWPVGEPSSSDFFFCGCPEADLDNKIPYCRHHTERSLR